MPVLRRSWFRSLVGRIAVTVVVAGAALVGGVGTAVPANAVTTQSCGFATTGTGTYAPTICWFDLSGYDPAQAGTASGQAMTQNLPGGYTLSFTMATTGGPIRPTILPTYSGAYLGNNGHYTGIPGKPALYQTASGTTTTTTLTNIIARDPAGRTVSRFALVGADAESTDGGESLSWTSSAPLDSLTATPTGNGLGNACAGGFTGVGTTQVTCTGSGTGTKTGTAILASTAPTTFAQTMHGQGLEAFAFGVLVSRVQLNKQVSNGFSGDAFQVSVASSTGSVVGSANTNGTAAASTGPLTVLAGQTSQDYTLSEQATTGTTANYTDSWACTRNGAADPSLPAGAVGPSARVGVGVGDFVNCTITNTAKRTAVTLVKQAGIPVDANGDGLVDAGDTIGYTFSVTNSGALPLNAVTVTDPKIGAVSCPTGGLPAGASVTCTAGPYTITAADMTGGSVDNTATATGDVAGTTGTTVSGTSSTSTPVVSPKPGISVTKTATPTTVTAVGATVTYSFAVTNTGNVPLHTVGVTEGGFTGTGTAPVIYCPGTSLAVAATETCVGSYTTTQADIDTGTLENTATAHGVPAGSTATIQSAPSTAKVTAPAAPALSLVKSAAPSAAGQFTRGQLIRYSFVLTNTGNTTLHNVTATETGFTGTGTAPKVLCPPNAVLVAPGDQIVCTASYILTQADVDARSVSNMATGTGTDPSGAAVAAPGSQVTIPVSQHSALTLTKTATPATVHVAGQIVRYQFQVTNTGDTTLHEVAITEGTFTGTGPIADLSCPTGNILPGQTVVCRADYPVQAADLATTVLTNTATAHATDPSGATIDSVPATASTTVSPASLHLQETGTPTSITTAGQEVPYAFQITNTGRVPLVGVGVVEGSFTGTGTRPDVSCPVTTLGIGASTTCTATYTVTGTDLTAANLSNTATATGTILGFGEPIDSNDSTAITTVHHDTVPPVTTPPVTTPPVTTPPGATPPPLATLPSGSGTASTPRTLAFTGSSPLVPAGTGLLFLVMGVVLIFRDRHSRS